MTELINHILFEFSENDNDIVIDITLLIRKIKIQSEIKMNKKKNRFIFSLTINVQSIELLSAFVSSNDKIRVSITTLPDEQKQAQVYEYKKLKTVQPTFKVEFKETTKKILIVLRKKSYLESDPIIHQQQFTQMILQIFSKKKIILILRELIYSNQLNI